MHFWASKLLGKGLDCQPRGLCRLITTAQAARMRRFTGTEFGICGKAATDFQLCNLVSQPTSLFRRLTCRKNEVKDYEN